MVEIFTFCQARNVKLAVPVSHSDHGMVFQSAVLAFLGLSENWIGFPSMAFQTVPVCHARNVKLTAVPTLHSEITK